MVDAVLRGVQLVLRRVHFGDAVGTRLGEGRTPTESFFVVPRRITIDSNEYMARDEETLIITSTPCLSGN